MLARVNAFPSSHYQTLMKHSAVHPKQVKLTTTPDRLQDFKEAGLSATLAQSAGAKLAKDLPLLMFSTGTCICEFGSALLSLALIYYTVYNYTAYSPYHSVT